MKRTIFALALLCFAITQLRAQDPCNTNVDFQWMQANAPTRYQRFMDLENLTSQYIASQSSTTRLINPNGLIIIPIVVHVLHQGEAEGQGLNISMAQIQS